MNDIIASIEDGNYIRPNQHTLLIQTQKNYIDQSAYPYIRLDDYAPTTNRTAIYLGPVKIKKAARAIYLPARARNAFGGIHSINMEFAMGKPGFNPHNLVFCTEEGHPFDAKVLEDGFHTIS